MLIESLDENLLSKTPVIVNIRDEKIIYDHINSILTIQSTLNPIKMF